MPIDDQFMRWYAARLLIAIHDTNVEHRAKMAVEVKGLAETVRQAKQAINKASFVAERVNASATKLVATIADVEAMTGELDRASADLQAALGQITNGGGPLDSGAAGQAISSEASADTITPSDQSPSDVNAAKLVVEAQNAANSSSVAAIADKYIPPATPDAASATVSGA